MPISSDALFHFTTDMDNLINILQNNFMPHFSLEDLSILFPGPQPPLYEIGIPMICFCDIPLSQTTKHIETYGKYGIGMKKDWGLRHGITPVLYTYRESIMANSIGSIIDKYNIDNGIEEFGDILTFLKPYEGKLWRNGAHSEMNIRFYDEREWRYVPIFERRFMKKERYLDLDLRTRDEKLLSDKFTVKFIPNDIKYLIVKDDSDIIPLINEIAIIKSKYDSDDVKILTTRIITVENISSDF
jgi:hypothetical protein